MSASRVGVALVVNQLCSDQIFQGAADTLEYGDLVGASADRVLAADQLMEIGGDVRAGDSAFSHGDKQVAGLGEGAVVGVYYNSCAFDRVGIHLARMRLKCAHKVQMSAGTKQVAVEEWCLRSSAGADDIGFGGTGAGVGRLDWQIYFGRYVLRECSTLAGVLPADKDPLKAAHERQN